MNNLNAFLIKFEVLTQEKEDKIEEVIDDNLFLNFTNEEQNMMIKDEKERVLIIFIPEYYKNKVDAFVESIKKYEHNSINLYENITDKFLYKNDFSHYKYDCKVIQNFIKNNLTVDDVLDKINFLGKNNLTKLDMQILESN